MKNNAGITMVEIILVMALLAIILPFGWSYLNSGIEDSNTINNKVMVQNSVVALMNQLQRDIQEARCPISPDDEYDYDESEKGFLICKPNSASIMYLFDEDEYRVTFRNNLRVSSVNLDINEVEGTSESEVGIYNYIKEFSLERVGENGVKIYIRGQVKGDERSGYTLTNTYYTRNTIF